MKNINLSNEIYTKFDDFPENPLLKKWEKEYPKLDKCKEYEELGLFNYSCLNCGCCPAGVEFDVPKEDLKEYKKYLEKLKKYLEKHNPDLANTLKLER